MSANSKSLRKQAALQAANAEDSRVLSVMLYREASNADWLADNYLSLTILELEKRIKDLEAFAAQWAKK